MNDAETIATVNNNSEKKRMYFAYLDDSKVLAKVKNHLVNFFQTNLESSRNTR